MIPVTKVFFPPQEEFNKFINEIWLNRWISNNGPLIQKLENDLKYELDVEHLIPMTNGTLPIQISLKVLACGGEVITTPFSYVATTSSIVWENCKPVFVDIDPKNLTIDEKKIEEKITSRTKAILATHVFGNPCNVEEIEKIAKKHGLVVIYDAAHAFGVKYKGNSLVKYGDISTCSFHATKIFHTGEGGALIINNKNMYKELFYRHNFGHNGQEEYHGLGINAKMSELSAAMGLSNLPYMKKIISYRKFACNLYDNELNFERIIKFECRKGTLWNYCYYPIILESEKILKSLCEFLNNHDIYPRRYFYPSLQNLVYINKKDQCPISSDISSRIICLPLYYNLTREEICHVSGKINGFLR